MDEEWEVYIRPLHLGNICPDEYICIYPQCCTHSYLFFYLSPLISSLMFSLFLCCAPKVISQTSPLSHLYRAYLHRLLLRLVAPLSVTAQVDHAIFPHLYIRYKFNVFPTVQRAPLGCCPFPVHGEVPGKKEKRGGEGRGEARRGEERRGENNQSLYTLEHMAS